MKQRAPRGEQGVALILALVFLTIGSFVVIALATQASTNLTDTSTLVNSRTSEYAADAALNGGVQQARYHAIAGVPAVGTSSCPSFPSTGSTKINSGVFIQVVCSGTPMTLSYPSPSLTLTATSPNAFSPNDQGQVVSDAASPANRTTIAAFVSSTSVTLTKALTLSPGSTSVVVGTESQRVDTFWACVSKTSMATGACNSTVQPVASAVVLFQDSDQNGNTIDPNTQLPNTGFDMTIESWVVNAANG